MQNHSALFLKQSYQDNWENYIKSLRKSSFPQWDYVILTASNEMQADAYRAQLEYRLSQGILPDSTHYAVIADPDGKRVGSGGATLNVLKYIREKEGTTDCFHKRFLVIHSGGDSKRVPQYSASGKLFSPVPRTLPNGRRSTLFDEFIIGLSGVPGRIREGMLVLSGDVLLLFNPLQIDFLGNGAAAVSMKADAQTGKNHGVFLADTNMNVTEFLHKQTVENLNAKGAVNQHGKVNIDTGAVILSTEILDSLFTLIATDGVVDDMKFAMYVNDTVRISFYADFLYPLASSVTLEQYYRETPEGEFSDKLAACRKEIWERLHRFSLKLIALSPAEFIHFGTTQELLDLTTKKVHQYAHLDWHTIINSNAPEESTYACNNAYIQVGSVIGENCYIEDSFVQSGSVVGQNCILSNVTLNGEEIPEQTVLHCLKLINGKFVVRFFGVQDNPKNVGKDAVLFGKSIYAMLRTFDISSEKVWDTSDHSLWEARLYQPCDNIEDSLAFAINLYQIMQGNGDISLFRNEERISLRESFAQADVTEILPWQLKVDVKVQAFRFINAVKSGMTTEQICKSFQHIRLDYKKAKVIAYAAESEDFSTKIRIYYQLSKIADEKLREQFEELCFQEIRNRIYEENIKAYPIPKIGIIQQGHSVIKLPVRINFGGGWSDTPPYCLEHGGTVLNAAILLNGKLPIQAELKRLDREVIVLASTDSGAYREFTDIDELRDCSNPYDSFALHKAALLVCGVIPMRGSIKLTEVIQQIGGGLYLSTQVTDIPRGSGLGTSSILAGACVKGIYEIFGFKLLDDVLFARVLMMEQLMSTGGGWQDQVGGLIDGFKFITTTAGIVQNIHCAKLDIPEPALNELNDRFSLIYTGQRRLARNLLRDIIGNYMGYNVDTLYSLAEIQKKAALMRYELERGNIDAFANLMNEHWELSKMLDTGCTNTCIEQIFLSIEDLIDGKMICGAGGGGFLQVIRKKGISVDDLRKRLLFVFQDSGVDVWDCKAQ